MPTEAWLALLLAGQTGSAAWRRALLELGTPERLAGSTPARLEAFGLTPATIARLKEPDPARLERAKKWLAGSDHEIVTLDDEVYPRLLREIADPPVALWLSGARPDLLDTPQLAMVGSRNATRGGLANAQEFAEYLGERGLTITSGLAEGIDGASHRGALETVGGTLAVLGSGIDTIYPRAHAGLAAQIEQSGLIVSEYAPGMPPARQQFPARNRVIAGLTYGVVVVEASRRSGSLITARLASEYGREVFAIPGSIHNPLARGCHWLIREGAKLVDDAPTVLIELAPLLGDAVESQPTTGDPPQAGPMHSAEYAELLGLVGFDPTRIDKLVDKSGLTTAEVSSMLLLLELDGLVEALPGGRYARLSKRR